MAAARARLLTAPTSKLAKQDLVSLLRRDEAWILLPRDIREQLYSLLPRPGADQPPQDADVHPLHTMYKPYIEEELRPFGEDLREGREQKKWRLEAMQAGKDRIDGKFDEWKEQQKWEDWGDREEVKGDSVNTNGALYGHEESNAIAAGGADGAMAAGSTQEDAAPLMDANSNMIPAQGEDINKLSHIEGSAASGNSVAGDSREVV